MADDPSAGEAETADGADACDCKLGRSARRYDLAALDAEVRRRHADGASLRDLEQAVNEALLERALERADADVLGDVESVYETLAGDAGTAGERTEVRRRLASAGVDVERLESDFVSYQTVRTHLRECLDVDTERETPLTRSDAENTIEWARSRSEGIVERTLERLARSDEIAAGDLEASSVLRVRCRDCGASATVDEFLDGGCDCEHDER